jgi:ParB/RepB/Spo0J family partition protein
MDRREIIDIPVDSIKAQILERTATQEGIQELAGSIRQIGIIEPLIVLKTETDYILQAGMRRLTAAKQIGLPTVPCIIIEADKESSIAITLHENLYRENLNPVDEAWIYQQLRDRHRYSSREIAKMVGQSEGYVSQRLQITLWPDNLIDALRLNHVSFSVARELSIITDKKHRDWLLKHSTESGVNYRTARRWRIEWQARVPEKEEKIDYTQPPPEPETTKSPEMLCWWCNEFHTPEKIITIQLCHQCFGQLQFSKDKLTRQTQ